MNEHLNQILTQFRNMVLNATGVRRDFFQLIADRDIDRAVGMMQDRDQEVDNAIKEYNPITHRIMKRPDKKRRKMEPYITEKLPRSRQKYINEVELFFLLGGPLIWKKEDGDDEAFDLFNDFIKQHYINAKLRKLKRLAGAETEASMVFRLFQNEENKMDVDVFVAARSTGYKLRPLFDQYGNLIAFAYGYTTREPNGDLQHWDILTPDNTFLCTKAAMGWRVETYANPTHKIDLLYAKQTKAWEGVEPRLDREERLDSKVADTNNYFADPIATATADVVKMMNSNNQSERIGQLIQLAGKESAFGYVNPPQNSETRRDEMINLRDSILFDTFTPDFSFERMKGLGTLSGAAIKNAMVLGYIKREKNMEEWQEYIDRMRNVIIAILCQLHPEKEKALQELKVVFEFPEPFASDRREQWDAVASIYKSGLLSLEEAVKMLALTKAPEEEIERIKNAQQEMMMADMEPVEEEGAPAEE